MDFSAIGQVDTILKLVALAFVVVGSVVLGLFRKEEGPIKLIALGMLILGIALGVWLLLAVDPNGPSNGTEMPPKLTLPELFNQEGQ